MTPSGESDTMVWIVTDEAGHGDACIRGVYSRASGAYARAADLATDMEDPSTHGHGASYFLGAKR